MATTTPTTQKNDNISMSGWLARKSKQWFLGNHWKKGFWVLDKGEHTLEEFRSEIKDAYVSQINLKLLRKIFVQGQDRFSLILVGDKELVLKSIDESAREKWVDALEELIAGNIDEKVDGDITDSPPRG